MIAFITISESVVSVSHEVADIREAAWPPPEPFQ